MELIPFTPLGDRVVILPDPLPEHVLSDGQIEIVSFEKSDKVTTTGTIVALGDTDMVDTRLMAGQRIVFSPWAGFGLTIARNRYVILSSMEILGILTREEYVDVE